MFFERPIRAAADAEDPEGDEEGPMEQKQVDQVSTATPFIIIHHVLCYKVLKDPYPLPGDGAFYWVTMDVTSDAELQAFTSMGVTLSCI